MPDLVVLRGEYQDDWIELESISGTNLGTLGAIQDRKNMLAVVQYLLGQGYTLSYQSADDDGVTMTFYRDTGPTPPPPPDDSLIQALRARLNTTVTISTNAGDITGVLNLVGTDVIRIVEPTGNIVLIPISQINGIE